MLPAGDARIAVLPAATGAELGAFVKANIAANSHLLTDGFAGYRGCEADLGEHVKHTPVIQDEGAKKKKKKKNNRRNLSDGLDGYLIRRAVECATITYDQLKAGAMPGGAERARRLPATVAEPALAG